MDALPVAVRAPLARFVETLREVFHRDLQTLAVYGPVLRGDFNPKLSDVNVLLVLRELDGPELRRLVEPVQLARREILLEPLLFSLEDLRRSTDVFALRILECQRRYQVLAGEDLLGPLFVSSEHVRLACEGEAKRIVLRLRQLYLVRPGLRPAWQEALIDNLRPLLRLLSFCLELAGRPLPTRVEELLEAAREVVGLDVDVLRQVLALRYEHRTEHRELERLFEAYLENAVKLASFVDRLSRA